MSDFDEIIQDNTAPAKPFPKELRGKLDRLGVFDDRREDRPKFPVRRFGFFEKLFSIFDPYKHAFIKAQKNRERADNKYRAAGVKFGPDSYLTSALGDQVQAALRDERHAGQVYLEREQQS